jgi:hypothetical protein
MSSRTSTRFSQLRQKLIKTKMPSFFFFCASWYSFRQPQRAPGLVELHFILLLSLWWYRREEWAIYSNLMGFLCMLVCLPTAAVATDWWVESSLVRVMPTAVSTTKSTASISLAANEHESFQIVLKADRNMTFDVAMSPLILSGSRELQDNHLEIRWEQVGFMHVSSIRQNTQGGAGWWPDVLLPVPKAFGITGVSTSLWFTVSAPPASAPGQYQAQVTITPTDTPTSPSKRHVPITVDIKVQVYDFALPIQPALLNAFDLSEANIGIVYNSQNYTHADVDKYWRATGCSNPTPSWGYVTWGGGADCGASDMFAYCTLTKAGTASPGQKAVCGTGEQAPSAVISPGPYIP